MSRALIILAALATVAGGASGCGSNAQGPAQDAATDGSFLTCAMETRALPYQPGMQVMSDGGALMIKLLDSTPGPPVKGTNTWTLEIDDTSSGAPLDGLDIEVTPWMPDHNHGTDTKVGVTPAGSGTYTLEPVYLYMAGFWQVKLSIVAASLDAGTISGMLPICIP